MIGGGFAAMDSNIIKASVPLFLALTIFSNVSAKPPDDPSIAGWVTEALSEDQRVASADIKVTALEGIVTLAGSVRNLVQKSYADLEAKKIKGVFGVVNKLTVDPVLRPDIEIRQAIRRRIINSSVISSESVGVYVNGGIVTLSGTVPSYSEKQEASLLAGEVRGVKSVVNSILVVNTRKRPDAEVRADAQAKIGRDVYLAGLPVTVSVQKGVATLTGEVDNAYEKERAGEDALQVSNIVDVNNDLKVRWWEMTGVRDTQPAPSDSAMAKSVEDELYADLRVDNSWDVHVKAKAGQVTLQGTLPTLRQKFLAKQDAMEVVGVGSISNRITVKGPWRDDIGINADARFALNSDYALSGDAIDLLVNNGTVTLTGNLNTPYEKSQAEKDVSGILGVRDIVDKIVVNWEPRYFDKDLKDRIKIRLAGNWATWPVAGNIAVTVQNGTATLTGTVATWAQYGESARIALLTKGVRRIDNRLLVKGVPYQREEFHSAPPDVLSEPDYTDPWSIFRYNR
jgi:osmotically-inducible protein OsmY